MDKQTIMSAEHLSLGCQGKNGTPHRGYENLAFRLHANQLTCLLGRNGAGKSVLLHTLAALQKPSAGELLLEGQPLSRYTPRELSRKIGFVPTDRIPPTSSDLHGWVAQGQQTRPGLFGHPGKKERLLIDEALETVGLAHKHATCITELSDGEKQKAIIAKALVQNCPLLLLDEPTAYLDLESRIEIMALLRKITREQDKTILLSTHDIEQALLQADNLWILSPERGLLCGMTEELALKGELDSLFPSGKLRFDHTKGRFLPITPIRQKALVRAKNETAKYWCIHLLNKNQWGTTHEKSDKYPEIEIISDHKIRWRKGKFVTLLRSFEELAAYLACNSNP